MDEAQMEALGFEAVRGDLERVEAMRSLEDLADLLAELHMRGVGGLFSVGVEADARRSEVYALALSQGGLNLPDREYYEEGRFAKERAAYKEYMRGLLRMAGRPEEGLRGEVEGVWAVEWALAKASRKLEDLGDPEANYHKLSKGEIEALAPSFPWKRYWSGVGLGEVEWVIVGQPEFLGAVEKQMRERTIEQWRAYLRWNVLNGNAPLLHSAADAAHFAFYGKVLEGQPQQGPRWKRAVSQVNRCVGEALGQMYVERHFSEDSRRRVEEMVQELKTVFRERLEHSSWMSPETKKEALAKLSRFRAKIGSPQNPRTYGGLEVRRDDALGNVQRAVKSEWLRDVARVGKPVDKSEWHMSAPTVNAYFLPTANEIVFPAGILQPPFFDPAMDDAVNYGAIGATIGHEMTHGYDNEGRKYDAEGNLRDWWSRSDARAFEKRARGLVTHFSGVQVLPKWFVNGKLTLAENIADLGGLRMAYLAMQRALEADPSKRRPVDGLAPEQRFFIAYAQSWAALNRPESLRAALTTDSHAPDQIRGYAPLQHLPEFYEAFGIRPGMPMYLPKKRRVEIW
jgi:predicted metalloendopeptidase